MNLKYSVISQPVTGLLAYKHGHAVVTLGNKRVAFVAPETLTKRGINPADGVPTVCLATRISAMRDSLIGSHATLRRSGPNLYVTGLYTDAVKVLDVSEQDVDEICAHAARGGSLTTEMRVIEQALRMARHATYRGYFARLRAAMTEGRENPAGLVDLRAQLQHSLVGHFV